ncbi:M24 family metallopeptidase [Fictibacillus aquaticus]|uniref:Peptidase M24 n=1 Tax=Fictibacillus aquaticus TaxID=2021314 RepID=A0A235F963_9BACL|nr:M24 family metallopeptidase [Fictibacillus aquaticus]OYD57487.1 peptidase M24 [Fictibacillus aquaticus]
MPLNKIRKLLQDKGLDGVLLRKKNNFSWVTGGLENHIVRSAPEGVADLVVLPDEVVLVTTKTEERRIMEEELSNWDENVRIVCEDWFTGTDALLEDLGSGRKMGTDTPFLDWIDVTAELRTVRSTLLPAEICRYRELSRDAAWVLESACKEIQPGQTEHEIAGLIAKKAVSLNIKPQVLLVATDERIYHYRHPIPTAKPLKKHALVVICAERGGLVANLTRVVHFGPLPEELTDFKERLARIDSAMILATVPGARTGDVISRGIQQYEAEGRPEDWKFLHQGGPTGYDSREFIATASSDEIVKENQVFTWNPSLPGVKSEDTFLVKKDGFEILTQSDNWPLQRVMLEGRELLRPDILIR